MQKVSGKRWGIGCAIDRVGILKWSRIVGLGCQLRKPESLGLPAGCSFGINLPVQLSAATRHDSVPLGTLGISDTFRGTPPLAAAAAGRCRWFPAPAWEPDESQAPAWRPVPGFGYPKAEPPRQCVPSQERGNERERLRLTHGLSPLHSLSTAFSSLRRWNREGGSKRLPTSAVQPISGIFHRELGRRRGGP